MSNKYALLIGVNEYHDSHFSVLQTPIADVKYLANMLSADNIGGFGKLETLINPSFRELRVAIADLFAEKHPDDLLLLYYSGHGLKDDKGKLLLTANDTLYNRANATAIDSSFISDEMDVSNSRRQVLILDCCYSGAFASGTKNDGKAIDKTTFEGNGFGRVVITATDSTKYAWEGNENSVFTSFLIQALNTGEADLDGDGYISTDELYQYVHTQMGNKKYKQIPKMWAYNIQGNLILARKMFRNLSRELRQSLENPSFEIRKEAVEQLGELFQEGKTLGYIAFKELKNISLNDVNAEVKALANSIIAREPGTFFVNTELLESLVIKIQKERDSSIANAITNLKELEMELDYAWFSGAKTEFDAKYNELINYLQMSHKTATQLTEHVNDYIKRILEAMQ